MDDVIDIYDLWKSFGTYVNTFQGGWYRPQTDFETACNDISIKLFKEYVQQAEKSQDIKDSLRNFLKSVNLVVSVKKSAYGKALYPVDYGGFGSARIITDGTKCAPSSDVNDGQCQGVLDSDKIEEMTETFYNNVKQYSISLIDNNKWGSVNEHETKSPTLGNPMMTQIGGGFDISPRTVSVIVLDYYVNPVKAVFAYTKTPGNPQTGQGDQIVYDKKNSNPIPWPATMVNEFLVRLGERYGAFTRDQFMAQFSTQQKKD